MIDRSDFEAWALSNGFDIERTDLGVYRVKSTDTMYGGWLAGVGSAVEVHSRQCAEWARICEYQKRHAINWLRGHFPVGEELAKEKV